MSTKAQRDVLHEICNKKIDEARASADKWGDLQWIALYYDDEPAEKRAEVDRYIEWMVAPELSLPDHLGEVYIPPLHKQKRKARRS